MKFLITILSVTMLMFGTFSAVATAAPAKQRTNAISSYDDVKAFMAEMVTKHQIDPQVLQNTFDKTKFDYTITKLMDKPAEKRTWTWYYNRVVTKTRITEGSAYMKTQKASLDATAAKYNVPANVITAILGLETNYGTVAFKYTAVQGLATLAFEYPRRAKFFRGELESLFKVAKAEGVDPLSYMGSFAGAVGIPQFMPSNIPVYAVDGDGDGKVDIVKNHADAIASVANYLKKHGWVAGKNTVALVNTTKALPKGTYTNKACNASARKTVKQMRELGVDVPATYKDDEKGVLVKLDLDGGKTQTAIFFENACPIWRYNNSAMYVMAIGLLAQEYK
jgi:membrane-bound lytic murein transglycosylase B